MPTSVTEHFKLDKARFDATGAFDAILDLDTHLFVDPFLLATTAAPELRNARPRLLEYFGNILKLLASSDTRDDPFWRRAQAMLQFNEIGAFGLGYSKKGTGGSGIGRELRDQLLATAALIVRKGINDPVIFELVGIFEEGIGCDRISDMICRVLIEDFLAYTSRIFTDLGQKFPSFRFRNKEYNIPINPSKAPRAAVPVILVPCDLLRDLPIAHDWDDIGYVCAENERVRDQVNQIIGHRWKEETQHYSKKDLKELLLNNPQLLRELIEAYKSSEALPYDIKNDPQGEVIWKKVSTECVREHPLDLSFAKQAGPTAPLEVARRICAHYKALIEDHGLWYLLYRDQACTIRKPERACQLLFFGIASAYCVANDLDISPESNGGRGPVDFKFSRGARGKVIVEAKLSTNAKTVRSYDYQVPIYQRAENADHAIYLVLRVSEKDAILKRLLAHRDEVQATGIAGPEIIIVDGLPRESASKA
ncbi:MAG: hypothetical protein NDJ89_18650 [Oligoflexia bacterium]|nr:hypothetical protein [Oligoflexia bacterium]